MDADRFTARSAGDGLLSERDGENLMPGAQPRRGFETRVASTARRGANVPPGVPGVYRVPRVRTVTAQAADPGSPTPSNPWIQPDDVTLTDLVSDYYFTFAFPNSGDPFYSPSLQNLAVTREIQTLYDSLASDMNWYTACFIFGGDAQPLDAPPVSPSPPVGMSVEYEAAEGVVLRARLRGSISNTATAGSGPEAGVWEMPLATVEPGVFFGSYQGPSQDPVGGAQQFLTTVTDPSVGTHEAHDFETDWQDFDETNVKVGWKIATTLSAFETSQTGVNFYTYVYGSLAVPLDPTSHTDSPEVEWVYTPPRYRFI